MKMFRLFFVSALAFLLSSVAKSQNKSANQVTKLITKLKVTVVELEFLCFDRACIFPNSPLIS